MTILELIAVCFGLACVALYVRQNVWSWPVGLVQVCLYVWIFFQARLYSDVLLHLVYVVLQLYGWYVWTRPDASTSERRVTRLTPSAFAQWLLVGALSSAALGAAMHGFTDAALPYADAAVAAFSLVAQYLLARKVLENWLVWIGVDVAAIAVYLMRGLNLTAALYAVFLCMAIAGWLAWRKSLRETTASASGWGAVSSSASSSPRTAATSSSSISPATPAAS